MLPYLVGEQAPPAPRLSDLQRCLRTDDIDAVGSNGRKMTSFHLLGSWSIGRSDRREAIGYALELLHELGIALDTLWVTVFGGDADHGLLPDEVAPSEWERAGIPSTRIVPLGIQDNFWSTGGPGPCGPDTEIFVDRGAALGCGGPECRPGCACERFLEIWNSVFIEYDLQPDGRYLPLPLRSVDTGVGLERVAAVLQAVPTVFEIDQFQPAWQALLHLTPGRSGDETLAIGRARRVIVDHVRAAMLAWLAGVGPDRAGRGSVVRRLIRRAARQGRVLGLDGPFLADLVTPMVEGHRSLLSPDEVGRIPALSAVVRDEEERFSRVLSAGLRRLVSIGPDDRGLVAGSQIFALLGDHGFPPDLAAEVLMERGLAVDWEGFEHALDAHRAVSRSQERA
jgi:alanyl-tRNA synthetase